MVKEKWDGYSSRSELVRDLIRELLVEDKWLEGEEVIGVLTLIYDHHQKELTQKMLSIQHHFHMKVLCSMHIHLEFPSAWTNIPCIPTLEGEPCRGFRNSSKQSLK